MLQNIPGSQTLGLQVYKYDLLWGLKSVNSTYFGLFGAPGKDLELSLEALA